MHEPRLFAHNRCSPPSPHCPLTASGAQPRVMCHSKRHCDPKVLTKWSWRVQPAVVDNMDGRQIASIGQMWHRWMLQKSASGANWMTPVFQLGTVRGSDTYGEVGKKQKLRRNKPLPSAVTRTGHICRHGDTQYNMHLRRGMLVTETFEAKARGHFFVQKSSLHQSGHKWLNTSVENHECPMNFRFRTLTGDCVVVGYSRHGNDIDPQSQCQITHLWCSHSASLQKASRESKSHTFCVAPNGRESNSNAFCVAPYGQESGESAGGAGLNRNH